jgi:formylglycine-generating enzyme required for sulfatase activity
MIWNAGADIPGVINGNCRVRVTADDLGYIPPGFVYIPSGTFQMGSPEDELGRANDETQHTVTISRGYFMARTEVTEQWWDEVMGSGSSTSQLPKAGVSWYSAVAFCNQLSVNEGLIPAYTGENWNREANGYRLPTEAEWEYACRAGSQEALCNGPITDLECSDPNLDLVGWYCGNSGDTAHEVGLKSANAWGLCDMHGNLWEWVWDARTDYGNLPSVDPVCDADPGDYRVTRGGGRSTNAQWCRSAERDVDRPYTGASFQGFRPVRTAF